MQRDEALFERLDACVVHARNLAEAAKSVVASGQPHIAFHLAILALEELGKKNLLALEPILEQQDVPPEWPRKHTFNHEQKLFWCLFGGPFILLQNLTTEMVLEHKEFARWLHNKRLNALYVDAGLDALNIPDHAVDEKEAEDIVNLAVSLVKHAEGQERRTEIPKEELELQRWFISVSDDPEHRGMVFSKASLEKLSELGSAFEWGKWLKSQIMEAQRKGEEALSRERQRSKALPESGSRPKWRIKFRIESASHSIRPKAFSRWNNSFELLQLAAVSGRKKELIGEIFLRDNVPVEAVYHYAWGIARAFVVALNIATVGCFWWKFSSDKKGWHEKIQDVDDPSMKIKLEQHSHSVDWGTRPALNDNDMKRVLSTFAALPLPDDPDKQLISILGHYISGLTHYAASDVHLPLEINTLGHFVQALRQMMIRGEDLEQGDPLEASFCRFIEGRTFNSEIPDGLLAIIKAYDASSKSGAPAQGPRVKSEHIQAIKSIADLYFQSKLQPARLEEIRLRESERKSQHDPS